MVFVFWIIKGIHYVASKFSATEDIPCIGTTPSIRIFQEHLQEFVHYKEKGSQISDRQRKKKIKSTENGCSRVVLPFQLLRYALHVDPDEE